MLFGIQKGPYHGKLFLQKLVDSREYVVSAPLAPVIPDSINLSFQGYENVR